MRSGYVDMVLNDTTLNDSLNEYSSDGKEKATLVNVRENTADELVILTVSIEYINLR